MSQFDLSVRSSLFPDLEKLSPATDAFAEQAHRETVSAFCEDAGFDQLRENITAMLRDAGHIPLCEEHNARMYHFLQDENNPKGVYRVSSSAMYRAGAPDWEILFAVADFDAILNDDVYLSGIAHCESVPTRVLLSLSPAGGDSSYIIEFDLESKSIVVDGFHFPNSKTTVHWRDANSVWLSPAWDSRQSGSAGYSREVWLLQRGQAFAAAQPIFRADLTDVSAEAWRYLDAQGAPLDLLCVRHSFFAQTYFKITANGQCEKIPLPDGAEICGYLGGFLLLRLRERWRRTQAEYLSGSLVAVKYARGALHEATELFRPDPSQSLECVETSRRFVLIHFLDNIKGCLKAWRLERNLWHETSAPIPAALSIELTDQPYGGDVFYFLGEDLLHPPVLYAWDANLNELSVMRRRQAVFDTAQLRIEQHFACSEDGCAIPYFWCGSTATPDTPTIVYAYGGFGVSTLPHYQEIIGKHWLEKGGALVLANIRGGGEYGPDWHHAAQREHKILAVTDLLAVVDDLQDKHYTSPVRTAVQGGSNGALIAAAAMCRAPGSLGVVIAEVPLADMLRYTWLGAGASWIEEYGDPDNPSFQAALAALSPLACLQEGIIYPPVLVTTDLHDDRVHPAHALKLYARLREIGTEAYLYLNEAGGHEGNAGQDTQAGEFAVILRFLYRIFSFPD